MVTVKSEKEIASLRRAREVVQAIMQAVCRRVGEEVTTLDLNQLVESMCRQHRVQPAFKGYMGYPYAICASVNDVVVHGLPSDKPLKNGDVVSIDLGIIMNRLCLDTAYTFTVGEVSPEVTQLLQVAKASCLAGVRAVRAGNYVQDISCAIEGAIRPHGYGIVRQYVGHGIGYNLHEEPQIPNYDCGERGLRLRAGMTLALEPMVTLGREEVYVGKDRWSVRTKDHSVSAHFEHTVLVTSHEPEILTYWPEESRV